MTNSKQDQFDLTESVLDICPAKRGNFFSMSSASRSATSTIFTIFTRFRAGSSTSHGQMAESMQSKLRETVALSALSALLHLYSKERNQTDDGAELDGLLGQILFEDSLVVSSRSILRFQDLLSSTLSCHPDWPAHRSRTGDSRCQTLESKSSKLKFIAHLNSIYGCTTAT